MKLGPAIITLKNLRWMPENFAQTQLFYSKIISLGPTASGSGSATPTVPTLADGTEIEW